MTETKLANVARTFGKLAGEDNGEKALKLIACELLDEARSYDEPLRDKEITRTVPKEGIDIAAYVSYFYVERECRGDRYTPPGTWVEDEELEVSVAWFYIDDVYYELSTEELDYINNYLKRIL